MTDTLRRLYQTSYNLIWYRQQILRPITAKSRLSTFATNNSRFDNLSCFYMPTVIFAFALFGFDSHSVARSSQCRIEIKWWVNYNSATQAGNTGSKSVGVLNLIAPKLMMKKFGLRACKKMTWLIVRLNLNRSEIWLLNKTTGIVW